MVGGDGRRRRRGKQRGQRQGNEGQARRQDPAHGTGLLRAATVDTSPVLATRSTRQTREPGPRSTPGTRLGLQVAWPPIALTGSRRLGPPGRPCRGRRLPGLPGPAVGSGLAVPPRTVAAGFLGLAPWRLIDSTAADGVLACARPAVQGAVGLGVAGAGALLWTTHRHGAVPAWIAVDARSAGQRRSACNARDGDDALLVGNA